MVFKGSLLFSLDNSGANIVKVIQIYHDSTLSKGFLGTKFKVTLYRRRKKLKRVLVKRTFYFATCLFQKKEVQRLNGHFLKSTKNYVALSSLNNNFLASRLYGPLTVEVKNIFGLAALGKRFV